MRSDGSDPFPVGDDAIFGVVGKDDFPGTSCHRYSGAPLVPLGEEVPKEDNWIHRSQGMRCNTCMYYVPKPMAEMAKHQSPTVGRCRRHAPTMSGFPVVYVNDWCGDHKLDEEKI
jgi:hypothetical protein